MGFCAVLTEQDLLRKDGNGPLFTSESRRDGYDNVYTEISKKTLMAAQTGKGIRQTSGSSTLLYLVLFPDALNR